jgi:dUTP pyrophosphatase
MDSSTESKMGGESLIGSISLSPTHIFQNKSNSRSISYRKTKVIIKRLDKSVSLPQQQSTGAAGFDLASSQDITLFYQDYCLVPTGLVIKAPKDWFIMLAARGSLYKKHRCILANGIGVIDSDYCGDEDEIMIPLVCLGDATVIKKGERIAQGILMPCHMTSAIEWEEVGSMGTTSSRGGFGSTGSN